MDFIFSFRYIDKQCIKRIATKKIMLDKDIFFFTSSHYKKKLRTC